VQVLLLYLSSKLDLSWQKPIRNGKMILPKFKPNILNTDLSLILAEICQSYGWIYGEAWIPQGKLLICHPAYYMGLPHLAEFRKEVEKFTFTAGAGLAGRVWLMQQPEWIEDVSIEPAIYYRAHLAKKAGLKAALGVPIVKSGNVEAVLIFHNDAVEAISENAIAQVCDRIKYLLSD
jgi:GAF domain-containing protein